MIRVCRTTVLAAAFAVLFGYTLKTGKCATRDQQLKTQREAIERTARLLAELERQIKNNKTDPRNPNQPQHAKDVVSSKKNEKEEEDT